LAFTVGFFSGTNNYADPSLLSYNAFMLTLLSICSLAAGLSILTLRGLRITETNCKLIDFVDYMYTFSAGRHKGHLPASNPLGGCILFSCGFLLLFGFYLIPTDPMFKFAEYTKGTLINPMVWLGFICFLYGMTLFQPKGDVLMGHDHRSPILFLRSFVDDEKLHFNFRDLAIFDFSLESRLATYFSRLGPFIAVGAPREQLAPAIGAARSALDDAEWQAQVVSWMQEAQIIIAMAGVTRWIGWELEQIINRGHQS
jgi:hypothetical protein